MEKAKATQEQLTPLEWLTNRLDEIVKRYTEPQEQRIGYGNLRYECSHWSRSSEAITNIAVIYETPGGSTAQINVTYDYNAGEFSYLHPEDGEKVATHDPRQVGAVIQDYINQIPAHRLTHLHYQIDTWVQEGKSRSQLFGELNKLLQAEFLGGRINTTELKQGIQYVIASYADEREA